MVTETNPESATEEKPTPMIFEQARGDENPQILRQTVKPWLDQAVEQAQLYQKAAQETLNSTIEASRLRTCQILSTSSAHFNQTLVSTDLLILKSEFRSALDKT